MRPKNEKIVCDYVRSIVSAATSSPVSVTQQPDQENRSTKDVEELWASPTFRFAIEHTLLESFPGQIGDDAKFAALLAPLEGELAGRLPGTYVLRVAAGASSDARLDFKQARQRIAEAVVAAAGMLPEGQAVRLDIENVPFAVDLFKRRGNGSRVVLYRSVSDVEPRRLERVRRALEDKCPKLACACDNGRISILALESNDIALANYSLVGVAVQKALKERTDVPSIVMLVETDGGMLYGWTLWNKTDIPLKFSYFEGQV